MYKEGKRDFFPNFPSMNPSPTGSYYRLITLWVVCEAFIGGIIHGLHIPVSGLIVGSAAITCISLIAWYHPKAGSIIRATIVVLIFKMLLSPQAPITAYVAVLFQGLLGELIFRNRKYFSAAAIVFAVIALLESAFQRFLIMTIIYGSDIWTAINFLLNNLTGQQQWTNYSKLFIAGYTAIHLVIGILLGYSISILPARIEKWKRHPLLEPVSPPLHNENKNWKFRKWWIAILWLLLVLLLAQSEWGPGKALVPSGTILPMLIRSLIIICSWILFLGPIMKWFLHRWLKNRQGKLKEEMEEVMSLLPATIELVKEGWQIAGRSGNKYGSAIRYILVNALNEQTRGTIYILSGPKGSGKTSSLIQWSSDRNEVYGILSPVVEGKRIFLDIQSREEFPMEALEGETDVLKVGKYIFSQKSFDRAIDILDKARLNKGWLIIDEVGPLELSGEGLNEVVLRCIKRNGNTIIVIREGLEEQVASLLATPVRIICSVQELLV